MVSVLLRRLAGTTAGVAGGERQPGPSRDQVHHLVNQLLDVGTTASLLVRPAQTTIRAAVRGSARAVAGVTSTGGVASDSPMRVLPLGPVAPGEKAAGELTVTNDGLEPLKGLELRCAALVSETGTHIPGKALSVTPNPMHLVPRSTRVVGVNLTVPAAAVPGAYAGLLSAVGSPEIRTLVIVEVA
jgi:hypothetical protein